MTEHDAQTELVLLPGMDGTALLFEPFMELASGWRPVTAIRYPDDAAGTTYEALESFVRDRLPTTRPFVIVAESFSGPLALRIAARRPPGLRGVVLCASFVRSPRPAVTWLAKRHGAILALRIAAGLPRMLPRIVLVGADAAPGLAKQVELVISCRVRPETLVARAAAIGAVDASEHLARCPVPVLCIRASRDRIVPESHTRRMAALNPAMEIAEIDAPHLVLQTRPRECLERIERFAARAGIEDAAR